MRFNAPAALLCSSHNGNAMAHYPKQVRHLKQRHFTWKSRLLPVLLWALLFAALFYGMHRYFEYRDRELDKRLERLH